MATDDDCCLALFVEEESEDDSDSEEPQFCMKTIIPRLSKDVSALKDTSVLTVNHEDSSVGEVIAISDDDDDSVSLPKEDVVTLDLTVDSRPEVISLLEDNFDRTAGKEVVRIALQDDLDSCEELYIEGGEDIKHMSDEDSDESFSSENQNPQVVTTQTNKQALREEKTDSLVFDNTTFTCPHCGTVIRKDKNCFKNSVSRGYIFFCPKCSLKTSKNVYSFKCHLCDFTAISQGRVNYHIRLQHWGYSFKCSKCSFSSATEISLQAHVNKVHENKQYECNICRKVFPLILLLHKHVNRVHNTKLFKCPKCSFKSYYQSTIRRHCLAKHTNLVFVCSKCNFAADSNETLKEHAKSQHPYVCSICNYHAKKLSSLKIHINKAHIL